jgi:anthranilate phosphoribosyltransferase
VLDAADFGVPRVAADGLRGGDAAFNAAVIRYTLGGTAGPVRDAVLINAAVALTAHEWAVKGVAGDLKGAIAANITRAATAVDNGSAVSTLDRWIEIARA